MPAATAAPGPHRDNDRRKPCCHDTASFLCDLNCQAPGPAGRPGRARPVVGLRPLPAPGPDSDSDPTERPAALMPPRPLSDAMPLAVNTGSRTVPGPVGHGSEHRAAAASCQQRRAGGPPRLTAAQPGLRVSSTVTSRQPGHHRPRDGGQWQSAGVAAAARLRLALAGRRALAWHPATGRRGPRRPDSDS